MSKDCLTCCKTPDLAQADPGYRRALAVVIALNLAMGAAEIVGGFLGRSQALKADALDFLGDGLITLLGFLALARGPRWRARAARAQAVFLALMGLGVIAAAVGRAIIQHLPSAATMGVLGTSALVINVLCALLLVRYRRGDASVRAVWLFSRNDAAGNLVVLLAAGLVRVTGTVWPDLLAALGIALLFLSSAYEIYRAARDELVQPG